MISSILLQTVTAIPDSSLARISINTGDGLSNIEYTVICIWSALMFIFLYFLSRRYTFGNWTPENPNPYKDETLGMPKGTMRGVITLTLLFFTIILELHIIKNPLMEYWTEKYITSFQMVLAFYFGSQIMSNVSSKEVDKAKIMKGDTDNAQAGTEEPGG